LARLIHPVTIDQTISATPKVILARSGRGASAGNLQDRVGPPERGEDQSHLRRADVQVRSNRVGDDREVRAVQVVDCRGDNDDPESRSGREW